MALSGIRVIDLTRILAGPFCTLMLADMGAEVIKVESAKGGDPVRRQGAIKDGISWYFAQFNRNKKSILLDLYTDEGKADLALLLETADVLVENYRPGVLWLFWPLCRPPKLRLHRPGDERLHERQWSARRRSYARRPTDE
jgi:crotonobetainyl-CoA:carnitine CoA-transferase CaiB-like acyl-CoA transferase